MRIVFLRCFGALASFALPSPGCSTVRAEAAAHAELLLPRRGDLHVRRTEFDHSEPQDHSGRLSARLPGHLLDARHGGRRLRRERAGNPDHPFTDGRLCVKVNHYEERVYHAERVLYPSQAQRPEGLRTVHPHLLGDGDGRDRLALEADHPAARPHRDPALQLSRHRGHPQRPERRRPVLQQARRHRHRAHLLRLRRVHRLHDDGRPDAGYRSRKLRALELHHPVGLQHASAPTPTTGRSSPRRRSAARRSW